MFGLAKRSQGEEGKAFFFQIIRRPRFFFVTEGIRELIKGGKQSAIRPFSDGDFALVLKQKDNTTLFFFRFGLLNDGLILLFFLLMGFAERSKRAGIAFGRAVWQTNQFAKVHQGLVEVARPFVHFL